ncbi:bifunctional adenosylcobinamide kinase/adenosylcobinamide-phosphate guanylyltransferase [Mangrovicoccus algicola]|uniref:Bifunctional adenosylcobalamin biosynthesis protein n=1 Tax=Mangrovicoccus algicola TaxID=2771008 RepID=A0A8J6Z4L1_9RHOB|nr:bifunctional adenosylcobinamide kinase/adenosylcobinamide-phosphate guanylyltransferase [Mangrovicoccus algicola]MBE3636641.1 bifunctional adenosylcobinamide kinase/adenosylcobinamide-phosphate guanylyltransferase [Mangrovicoccus algicola]
MLPNLTLVLGGAASGKSKFAESLIVNSGLDRVYLATAEIRDEEMSLKIAAHRQQRGAGWTTIEAPLGVAEALHRCPAGAAILLDCATMWLSNVMLSGADPAAAEDALMAALETAPGPVVVVSNELGQGVVPENALARRFREAQGRLNQRLAAQAGLAVLVAAGLPLALKGRLP